MEKKFVRFVSSASETARGVIIPDGRMLSFFDENDKWYMNYDTPFDIKTGEIYPVGTELGGDVVCVNSLAGWPDNYHPLPEIKCYDTYDIFCGEWKELTSKRLHNIISEFKEHGYDVDKDDVIGLFDSWREGWKTGIRNEGRNYHLFCPCGGCNPFSVRLTTLHPKCADWQKTYWC